MLETYDYERPAGLEAARAPSVRGVEVTDSAVRAPWPADVVRGAPSYEVHGDLAIGHDTVIEITPETERAAYEHYGVEPLTQRPETVDVVRFRLWRIQSF